MSQKQCAINVCGISPHFHRPTAGLKFQPGLKIAHVISLLKKKRTFEIQYNRIQQVVCKKMLVSTEMYSLFFDTQYNHDMVMIFVSVFLMNH